MSETRRKTSRITVRAEPHELAEFEARARIARITVPEYLRRSATGRRIDHAAKSTAEALRELSRIGSNLNQLSRLAHLGQHNQKDIALTLAEVRNAAARLTGSEPSA